MSPELASALRQQTPTAPLELRERVVLIASTAPPRRRTFPLRRALLLGAPAAAAASLAAAVVVGVISSAKSPAPATQESAALEGQLDSRQPVEPTPSDVPRQLAPLQQLSPFPSATPRATARRAKQLAPVPNTTRAKQVQADLRILVDDPDELSAATQQALRTTRRLGGYVVAVQYGTPEPSEGTASLRVRIPVSRVQAAIVQFSDLGRILAQQTQITDLQQQLDELTRQLRRAKGNKARIAALRRQRTELNRRAAFATLAVDLTTHEPEQKATPPGRLERAVDDALGVLAAELAIGAYALIVAGPFLLLLAAAFAGRRAYRRYADQQLLERA